MVCSPLDTQLTKLAKKYNLHYTRYADDISFSSYRDELPTGIVYEDLEGIHIGKELREILSQNSFAVNSKKTRVFDYLYWREAPILQLDVLIKHSIDSLPYYVV